MTKCKYICEYTSITEEGFAWTHHWHHFQIKNSEFLKFFNVFVLFHDRWQSNRVHLIPTNLKWEFHNASIFINMLHIFIKYHVIYIFPNVLLSDAALQHYTIVKSIIEIKKISHHPWYEMEFLFQCIETMYITACLLYFLCIVLFSFNYIIKMQILYMVLTVLILW